MKLYDTFKAVETSDISFRIPYFEAPGLIYYLYLFHIGVITTYRIIEWCYVNITAQT